MAVLVTGAAGFIGLHVSEALLARGERVLGIDNLTPYYDPALKEARLARLRGHPGFAYFHLDIAEEEAMNAWAAEHGREVEAVIHLAAQAGVRYSLEQPMAYVKSNLVGHMVILELCRRRLPRCDRLVYASSSSVYGANREMPFSVADRVDDPVSLYAATKRADELLSESYARLYDLPQTGLRFFTVYGPWGRPDMAYYGFAEAIAAGRPITLYNHGRMRRDFTYIDDVTAGVLAARDRLPEPREDGVRHRIYNLGNNRPVELEQFVRVLEAALGARAKIEYAEMQPGDVVETWADIEASRRDLGYEPRIGIEEGLGRFAAWYRAYHGAG